MNDYTTNFFVGGNFEFLIFGFGLYTPRDCGCEAPTDLILLSWVVPDPVGGGNLPWDTAKLGAEAEVTRPLAGDIDMDGEKVKEEEEEEEELGGNTRFLAGPLATCLARTPKAKECKVSRWLNTMGETVTTSIILASPPVVC